ncbi:hypothetical protein LI053_09030 [Clostridium perfringens]|uniref:hypothetical protein n=1 Tax=Clostridium perfringens TaxID=1502 RepID=UPI0022465AE9|nr:hypothetical protein [Clostridium perfringens]MCX0367853.1 hypothetical protein [Clostridium perfringens]MCX0385608.1 hypothetical protein [Clostridium perfringens]
MNSKGIGTKKLTSIISLIMTVIFLSILLPTNLIKAEEKSDSMSVEKVLDSEMYNKVVLSTLLIIIKVHGQ